MNLLSPTDRRRGALGAATAMFCVGTSAGVSPILHHFPVYGGQAVRYLVGFVILLGVARAQRLPSIRLNRREVLLLMLLAVTGLAAFNVLIIESTRYADPAVVGTVIATVPIVLAVLGPLLDKRRPTVRIVLAALVVAGGAAVSSGFGGCTFVGLLLALGALACEVGFSLLAVPLLPRLGATRVSAYSSAAAVPILLGAGAVVDEGHVLRIPTPFEALALAYLAVVVTSFAFLCWYSSLPRLGADVAGLFSGFLPIGAIVSTVALGTGQPDVAELLGAILVVGGLLLGMARPFRSTTTANRPAPPKD
ncbi:MAG: DMT family transporter [Pseudonocardiaceae bacterium]